VRRWLSTLHPREERLLRLRYGIGLKEPASLETVGRLFGVSRERVRQIQQEAIEKLRGSPGAGAMQDLA
jgi:RNA polymerase primary sigma factor